MTEEIDLLPPIFDAGQVGKLAKKVGQQRKLLRELAKLHSKQPEPEPEPEPEVWSTPARGSDSGN